MENNKLDLTKIKALMEQIKELEEELKWEKEVALEYFRNMTDEDKALTDCKLQGDGVTLQYFPKSTSKIVDTSKMKQDGIYNDYLKLTHKSDFVKITSR